MDRIGKRRLVLCLVGSVVAAQGGSPPPVAAAEYGSPRNLGFTDFTPQSPGSESCLYDGPSEAAGGFIAGDSPGGVCCLVAPVYLPQGATVTSVFFYVRDQSGDDLTLSLRRKRLDSLASSSALGTATSSGSGAGVRIFSDVTITNGVVDNDHYSYFVSTDNCLDQELDMRLYGGLVFFSE